MTVCELIKQLLDEDMDDVLLIKVKSEYRINGNRKYILLDGIIEHPTSKNFLELVPSESLDTEDVQKPTCEEMHKPSPALLRVIVENKQLRDEIMRVEDRLKWSESAHFQTQVKADAEITYLHSLITETLEILGAINIRWEIGKPVTYNVVKEIEQLFVKLSSPQKL